MKEQMRVDPALAHLGPRLPPGVCDADRGWGRGIRGEEGQDHSFHGGGGGQQQSGRVARERAES